MGNIINCCNTAVSQPSQLWSALSEEQSQLFLNQYEKQHQINLVNQLSIVNHAENLLNASNDSTKYEGRIDTSSSLQSWTRETSSRIIQKDRFESSINVFSGQLADSSKRVQWDRLYQEFNPLNTFGQTPFEHYEAITRQISGIINPRKTLLKSLQMNTQQGIYYNFMSSINENTQSLDQLRLNRGQSSITSRHSRQNSGQLKPQNKDYFKEENSTQSQESSIAMTTTNFKKQYTNKQEKRPLKDIFVVDFSFIKLKVICKMIMRQIG
ncbi:UNKNOWN [Stylonychia lemnae]|uniref:Uncharacterized protein n=1 Tax=Stylonychia lemnae TaxID=5949 RepID=A0A077ZRB9_STYLE|nr:UNKNOWN [Stylonychia lemnae]|eukprot:CDW71885.1 UNKNOWN [Stylonychia lemnae]